MCSCSCVCVCVCVCVQAPRTPQPLFEEPEEEEEEEAPPTKPPVPISKPPTVEGGKKSNTDSPRSGAGQKRRQKPKREGGETAGEWCVWGGWLGVVCGGWVAEVASVIEHDHTLEHEVTQQCVDALCSILSSCW